LGERWSTVSDIWFSINFPRLILCEQSTNPCCVCVCFLKGKKRRSVLIKIQCFIIPAKKTFSKVVSISTIEPTCSRFFSIHLSLVFSSLSIFYF
jgi:hypothetical protein